MFEGHREPASRAALRVGDMGNRARQLTRDKGGGRLQSTSRHPGGQSPTLGAQDSGVIFHKISLQVTAAGHRQEQMFLSLLRPLFLKAGQTCSSHRVIHFGSEPAGGRWTAGGHRE